MEGFTHMAVAEQLLCVTHKWERKQMLFEMSRKKEEEEQKNITDIRIQLARLIV